MEFSVQQIAALLNGTIEGDPKARVSMLAKIQEAGPGQIAFLSNPKYEPFLYTSGATAVIINKNLEVKKKVNATLIRVDDAYIAFTVLLEQYAAQIKKIKSGIEQPSYIGEGSTAGEGVYRGAFSYIGNNVKIGKEVKIFPNVFIGDNCTIGDHTIVYAGVKIYGGNRIGSHCELHAGAVIGSDGFGFAPQPDGSYKPIPQLGNVILEDHVTIGANTVVDCATMLGDHTVIGTGTRLDNLVQVAHNVQIGKHTVIAAQAGISGSSKIGDQCMIGGQAGIGGHVTVANHTAIGGQAGITKNVSKEGTRLFGTPAYGLTDYHRSYAIFKMLPDLYHRLQKIEEELKD
ncbi:MAG: UDP-3-O-(3-hydroxymyristoyl)glucosamine N-acyltransferase [Bacteroidetes bacterium]|nr:UDP-3-O-(3-hydroxymyristoyl)glucosamine N-acyltransferase [Bacteroidota bacterium]